MRKINVLVIDDSAFMRKLISDFLMQSPQIHVIGTSRNGEDGVQKVKKLKPDVVTMDIEMPVLNGLEALKLIMREQPVPVIMLSSSSNASKENTFAAFQYGAVDFIVKPSGSISLDLHKIKEDLIKKVIAASRINQKHLMNFSTNGNFTVKEEMDYSKIELTKSINYLDENEQYNKKKLICIGTSTGGPRALQTVLTMLPKNLNAAIFIVQHMPAGFTKSLAKRLNSLCQISVKEAEDGEIVLKGTAYIAPGGYHLTVKESGNDLMLCLDQMPERNGHRPSVDVLFEAVSKIPDYSKVAVIMTGMGTDGVQGLKELKKTGMVKAIAESKETSIVFGMPKAAIATNLIDKVQDVHHIAESIMKYV